MEISSPGQKSQVALQQGIVPGSCPARVSGENSGSRLLDMAVCKIRQTLFLDTTVMGVLQMIRLWHTMEKTQISELVRYYGASRTCDR